MSIGDDRLTRTIGTGGYDGMMKMFKKKSPLATEDKLYDPVVDSTPMPVSAAAVAPTVVASQPTAKIVQEKPESEISTVGAHCKVTGDIDGQGDIHISGVVEGNVRCAKVVRVLKQGQVKGEIHAAKIIIDGLVNGTCCGETVEILENGRVEGVIQSNDFAINKKGRFVGISEAYPADEKERRPAREQAKGQTKQAVCA